MSIYASGGIIVNYYMGIEFPYGPGPEHSGNGDEPIEIRAINDGDPTQRVFIPALRPDVLYEGEVIEDPEVYKPEAEALFRGQPQGHIERVSRAVRGPQQEHPVREVSRQQWYSALQVSHGEGRPVNLTIAQFGEDHAYHIGVGGGVLVADEVDEDTGQVTKSVDFPVGAEGRVVPRAEAYDELNQFKHWMPVKGKFDGFLKGKRALSDASLYDLDGTLSDTPYAIFFRAEPIVDPEVIGDMQKDALREVGRYKDKAGIENRISLEQAEAEYENVRKGASEGLWNVEVFVGTTTRGDCRRAAIEVAKHLNPGDEAVSFAPVLGETKSLDQLSSQGDASFVATNSLLANIAETPDPDRIGLFGYEQESRPSFVANQRPVPEGHKAAVVGRALNDFDQPRGNVALDLDALNGHALFIGGSRKGKTEGIKALIEEAVRQDYDVFIIDPKTNPHPHGDYADIEARVPGAGFRVWRPGDERYAEMGFNPMEPAPGTSPEAHAHVVLATVVAMAAQGEGRENPELAGFLQHYGAKALFGEGDFKGIYEEFGFDPKNGRPLEPGSSPTYPNMHDFAERIHKAASVLGFKGEWATNVPELARDKVKGASYGAAGAFTDGIPVDAEQVIHGRTIFRPDLMSDDAKVLAVNTAFYRIMQTLQQPGRPQDRKLLVVIEEVNYIAEKGQGGKIAAALLERIGGMNVCIIGAGQNIEDLDTSFRNNTATKVSYNVANPPAHDILETGLGLTGPQAKYLASLPIGRALVKRPDTPHAVLTQMTDPTGKPNNKDLVAPPDGLADSSFVGKVYPMEVTNEADKLLENTNDGRMLTELVEMSIVSRLFGGGPVMPRPDSPIFGPIRTMLANEQGGLTEDIFDAAVEARVRDAVDRRSDGIGNRLSREQKMELKRYIMHAVKEGLRGNQVEEPNTDFTIDRFMQYKAQVYEHIEEYTEQTGCAPGEVPPLDDAADWNDAEGVWITGRTAVAQLQSLKDHGHPNSALIYFARDRKVPTRYILDVAVKGTPLLKAQTADANANRPTTASPDETNKGTMPDEQTEISDYHDPLVASMAEAGQSGTPVSESAKWFMAHQNLLDHLAFIPRTRRLLDEEYKRLSVIDRK